MKKLISMTDFVLDLESKTNNIKNMKGWSAVQVHRVNSFVKVANYANFLKQPLKLEMFVPCDDDGNVLPKVPMLGYDSMTGWDCPQDEIDFHNKLDIRRKAKEKVLFEGLTVQTEEKWIEFYGGIRVFQYEKEKEPHKWFGYVFRRFDTKEFIIEYLVKYDLALTQSAIKQIGI